MNDASQARDNDKNAYDAQGDLRVVRADRAVAIRARMSIEVLLLL